jgi:hypothetical protein
MSARQPLRPEILPLPRITEDAVAPCACGFATTGSIGSAYNEEAFRYFLNIESRRAERSGSSLLLVLVDEKGHQPAGRQIESTLADRLFTAFSHGLRETDFFGWYQDHRVAGAVLLQRGDASTTGASAQVRERVVNMIARHLPPSSADRLQVRVFELPSKPKESD